MNSEKDSQLIKDFVVQYLKEIDFGYWNKRIEHCAKKLRTLKTDRAKKVYIVDLYSAYLQILEVFFINALAMSTRESFFFQTLFINNQMLKERVEHYFSSDQFISWFMNHLVFGINEKSEIFDFKLKRDQYINILKECKHDYLSDYNLLNAFKHGYRVKSSGGYSLSLSGYKLHDGRYPVF